MSLVFDPPSSPPLLPVADDGSNLWELLYESLGFHVDDDSATGYTLRKFCEGWCAPGQPVYDLVRERSDAAAWEILFDPDRCPAERLPFLAQCIGLVITPEMTEQQIRNEIREPISWARGREPAIRLAAQRTLTGARRVIIRPRTPEVGIHYIRTLLDETPDPARTEAVLRAALPAWEILEYEAIDGVSWADVAAGYEDWAEIASTFSSWADLADILPDELPEP